MRSKLLVVTALTGVIVFLGIAVASFVHFPERAVAPTTPETSSSPAEKAAPQPPTAEGQAILDAIKAAGYPSADKMSPELKTRIVAATNSGDLKTIDQDVVGMVGVGFVAKLVGFTTSDQCADQDVCLVVITNDQGTFVSYVMDSRMRSDGTDEVYGLGGFFGGDKYLITGVTGLGEASGETGYLVTIPTGVATKIATIFHDQSGATTFDYEGHEIQLTIGDTTDANPSEAVMGSQVVSRSLKFVDEKGKVTNLTRTYDANGDSRINPVGNGDAAVIDFVRTASSVNPASSADGEPLRPLMKFHDKGLYMWIYGGLYYYDPATGTIGLDLSQSP